MTIYFLSGLGADSRVFKNLTLPVNAKPVFIDWLVPGKNESLREYARRISGKIDTSKPFILIGLSFGGILATEVMEFVKAQKTILISSVARRQELPLLYRIGGYLQLNKLMPLKMMNRSGALVYWLFGISGQKDKKLFNEIIAASDTRFSKWAVNEILHWTRTISPENLVRIHGNKDKILPVNHFKPDHLINGGGHLMIINKANEISRIIEAEMEKCK